MGVTRILSPLPRSEEAELLDGPILDRAELSANLRDIRRVNRLLGGTATVLDCLPDLLNSIPLNQTVRLLDLATGSGDIPIALADWATRHGRQFDIVASDLSDDILAVARDHIGNRPGISLARHDARSVSLPDGSVDIVLCSLSLHHLSVGDAVQVLREMRRLARVGFIVNDLRRGRMGFVAAWVAARATTRNRLTRNDAPLSVRRAFTPGELANLLQQAGVEHPRIRTHLWFRMAAVCGVEANG